MAALTTTPSRLLRMSFNQRRGERRRSPRHPPPGLPGMSWLPWPSCGASLGGALAQDGLSPGQVPAGLGHAGRVLGHPHRQLEAEIEELLRQPCGLMLDLLVREIAPLRRLHAIPLLRMGGSERPPNPSAFGTSRRSPAAPRQTDVFTGPQRTRARVTNLVVMPIFWAAVRKASRASSSLTPCISYMMRPGFTTATHSSGFPLPFPIRVSAGFLVTGLSGKIRIHTLPPRLRLRLRATRAASICLFVTQPGSSALRPYSPKARVEPRWALPFMRPRWVLRYLTRLGISMAGSHASWGAVPRTSPLKIQTLTPTVPAVVCAVARP